MEVKNIMIILKNVDLKATYFETKPTDYIHCGCFKRIMETYLEIVKEDGFDYEKDVICDMMKKWPVTKELFQFFDVLVDGKFMIDLLDLKLRFRGSSNQRIIDIPKSRAAGEVVLWKDEGNFYG